MASDPENTWSHLLDEDDEIEIIEVVGMEEDSPGAAPVVDDPELVVDFGEEDLVEEPAPALAEPAAAAPAAPDVPAQVAEISDDDARETLVRLQADFENLRKRVERERTEYKAQATVDLVTRLLPIVDNLERALDTPAAASGDAFYEGVVLIFRQLLDELRKEGVAPIEATGHPFNPNLHEAVEIDQPGHSQYRVVEEVQRGYRLNGRLIRPSLVKVVHDPTLEE